MAKVSAFLGLVGIAISVVTGYLVIRGPFLGGEMLDPLVLLGTTLVFILGLQLSAWGITRYLRSTVSA